MKKFLFAILLLGSCAHVNAENSVFTRICETDSLFSSPLSPILSNPIFADMRAEATLTSANAGYNRHKLSSAPVAALGEGYSRAFFKANTFIRTKEGALGGYAGYNNDLRYNIRCNETSDAALLYPYLTADSVGGDMRSERYTFGAFYNGHSNRIHYGVSISYTALQEYRSIDPRPKNTSSRPGATLGLGYETDNYRFALGLEASKYKQNNSIKFVSELGEAKIYHLSGLGVHYVRFAGNSKLSSYNGWDRSISLNVMPVSSGFSGTLSFKRFSFDKILSDINNLPLASSRLDTYTALAGYNTHNFTIAASFNFNEQKGAENIFGSPQGNVYPEIASLQTFQSHNFIYRIQASWRKKASSGYWSVRATGQCSYSSQEYTATSPERNMEINSFEAGVDALWKKSLSRKVLLQAGANTRIRAPFSCRLEGIDSSANFINYYLETDYFMASRFGFSAGASLRADYALNEGLAIGLHTQYAYNSIKSGTRGNNFAVGAILSF